METKKIVAVFDGNHLCYRAFCTLKLSDSKGRNTSVMYGVLDMLNAFIEEFKPYALIVCWDFGKSKYRSEILPTYKEHRVAKTEEEQKSKDDFHNQLETCKSILNTLGVTQVQKYGFEGDDIIWVMARFVQTLEFDALIVSSDKDLLQIVQGKKEGLENEIYWLDPIKKKFVSDANFTEQVGMPKDKFLLYKALIGDDGDDIPGIKGIGEVRGKRLALKYSTIDEVSANTGLSKEEQLVKGQLETLKRNMRLVDISKSITAQDFSDIIKIAVDKKTVNSEEFKAMCQEYEMNSLLGIANEILEQYQKLLTNLQGVWVELQ